MYLFICLLAAGIFSPGDVPIPVGRPAVNRQILVREIGCGKLLQAQSFRFLTEEGDRYLERSWGRGAGRRTATEVSTHEYARVWWVAGDAVGARADIFISDRWLLHIDIERSNSGVDLKTCLSYFPYECVEVGVGWEPLRPRVFIRLGCAFREWEDLVFLWASLRK